jgi:hypothetical protein
MSQSAVRKIERTRKAGLKAMLDNLFKENVARHEASHAVVSAYLSLPLIRVSLNTNQKGSLIFPKAERGRGHLGVADHGLYYPENVPATKLKQDMRNHIVVCFAGEGGEKANYEITKQSGADGDRKLISKLLKVGIISEQELPRLKRRAEKIVRIPFVRFTIETITEMLCKKGFVEGSDVRALLNSERAWQKRAGAGGK